MKMIFFQHYEREGEYFVGKGKRIEGEIQDYLKNTPFNEKAPFMQHFRVDIDSENGLKRMDIYKTFLERQENMLRVDFLLSANDKPLDSEKKILRMENRIVEYWNAFVGPIGRNAFEREGQNYVCRKFKLEKEWFDDEYKKLRKLSETFHEYHGLETEIEYIPEEFEELEWKRRCYPNPKQLKALNSISEDQENIIFKYYEGEKLTKEEKSFFDKIPNEAKEAIKTYYPEKMKLTNEEKKKLEKYKKKQDEGVFYKKTHFTAKQDEKTRTIFLDALNDVMHNVREVRSWDKEHDCFITEQIPINCFGYFALFALQSIKTNKGYYNCEGCGHAELFSHKSIKMCEPCKTAKRKRKSYIKKDMLQGLSFEEIVKKHPRTKRDELQNHYKELKKELNM